MDKIKEYPETHQQGVVSIGNEELIFDGEKTIDGDFGIQIAPDGRIWVCINGISFIRFNPNIKNYKE